MAVSLSGKHFLTLKDFSPEEILYFLQLAQQVKAEKKANTYPKRLSGKNICLLFEKTSTRTRCAFEVAAYDEGAHVTYLNNSQMGKKESIEDTAKVLGRFYDGIEFRGYAAETVNTLAAHAGIPVWNGLTDEDHPTQILADFLTIMEHCEKPLKGIKFVYAGDARNNMGNALLIGCVKLGMHFVALAPKELFPDENLVSEMSELAKQTGAIIELSEDIAAVKGADVIYTDVWVSMGEEHLFAERIKQLMPYQVNAAMVSAAENKDLIFLHCLPAFHDTETEMGKQVYAEFGITEMEVTDEVFRSDYSKVFDQAENRMHTIKAIMVATIGHTGC